jgi:peptidoglycan/xylan/chitin deacetylase (PgdA/CDA1 family)
MPAKELLKNAIFGVLAAIYPKLGPRASILMYHSVGENRAFFAVSPREFERQLQYLSQRNLTVLKLSELVDRLQKKQDVSNAVCITFDDGYVDNYEIVFPLLKKYNLPMSLFLTTGLVGKTFTNSEKITLPMLSEVQIREMHESGLVEFLPHGEHHKKLHALSDTEIESEVGDSMKKIQAITGSLPSLFAYPSGFYIERTIQVLQQLGIRAAVTVHPGLVSSLEKPFELPRNAVDSKTSFVQFRAKVSDAIEVFQKIRGV